MELKNVIASRRSIRHYLNKEIPKDKIEDIINCGILAPSAKNRQPWNFIVIQDNKDLKSNIADILEKKLKEATPTCNVIRDCSAIIMVYADIENIILDTESVGAAIENMLLRAEDLGLASLWIGYTLEIEEELKELLNTNKTLIATIALGYSEVKPSPRPRKTLAEVTTWL